MEASESTEMIDGGNGEVDIGNKRKLSELDSAEEDQKRCRGEEEKSISQMHLKNWENLDLDVSGNIFRHLNSYALFWTLSFVCTSWRIACWDHLFWKSSVFSLGASCRKCNHSRSSLSSKNQHNQLGVKMMILLKSIMEGSDAHGRPLERWRNSILKFCVPRNLNISDVHLLYVAERTPNLIDLELLGSSKITSTGFAKATSNWKYLQRINLGEFYWRDFHHFMRAINRSCPQLKVLCISKEGFNFNFGKSTVMTLYLKGLPLERLIFRRAHLDQYGIHGISHRHFPQISMEFDDCFFKCSYLTPQITFRLSFDLRRGKESSEWAVVNSKPATMRSNIAKWLASKALLSDSINLSA